MARSRKKYTLEFKQEAVRLVSEEDMSIADAAADLGISKWSLRDWCRKAEAGQLKGEKARAPQRTMTPEEEIAKLRREVRILKEEREILKKAAAFFARENQ